MTNIYFRVRSLGFQEVEIERLTPEQRREVFAEKSTEEIHVFMDALCKTIKKIEVEGWPTSQSST